MAYIKRLMLLMMLVPLTLGAQNDSLVCRFETAGMAGSGDYAPFWHTSNRQGLASTEKNNGYVRLAAVGNKNLSNSLDLGYGVDLGAGTGLQSALFVHQLYADLDYRWLELSVGMKERWGELRNSSLSSGGLTWSGNSRPIPQARIGLPGFVRLPILGRWFSVKTHIAYGRFTDDRWRRENSKDSPDKDRYTDKLLFHSKDFFLRIGDAERFPIEATVGLEMYAVFGGVMHNRKLEGNQVYDVYRLPSDFNSYITVLLPFNAVGEQGKENGNTLGSWHLSFDYKGQEWGARLYYEHFFEDHSSMLGVEYKNDLQGNKDFVFYGFRRNWFDGMFGLEINLPERLPVRNVVLEVLNTRGQCGPIYKAPVYPVVEGVDGRDAMYNHDLYDSYSMYGYAIGNPVLLSPVYNKDCSPRFRSNRVLMYHLGIDGCIWSRLDYRAMLTSTSHWGTYEDPFNEVQRVTSCLLEGSYRLGDDYGWRIGLSLGFDVNDGDMTGNNTGVMFKLTKSWKLL